MKKNKITLFALIVTIALAISVVCYSSKPQKKHAIVSGQSTTGLIAAIILAKAGYIVDTYEIRSEYTRNIQWAARQSLVDELTSIDEKLAREFLEKVAKPLCRGSIHINLDGTRRQKKITKIEEGNPLRIPKSGSELMQFPSVITMEAKVFENYLKQYLQRLPNVHCHQGSIKIAKQGDSYHVENHGVPDLIVIAEGANSRTCNILGIHSYPTTGKRLQISGVVHIDTKGVMIKQWRKENGKIMLTGIIGHDGIEKTWLVADVDPSLVTNQQQIDTEFRRLVGLILELPADKINSLKISGAVEDKAIRTFFLQQKVVDKAVLGDNLLLVGDAVGVGHWSSGGGMQIGTVCHAERLKKLIASINENQNKLLALENFSAGVINDTLAWEKIGSRDFFD